MQEEGAHYILSISYKKGCWSYYFSSFDCHSSPLFRLLGIIIFLDLAKDHNDVFMYEYQNQLLISVLIPFFTKVDQMYSYYTMYPAKLSYYLPR